MKHYVFQFEDSPLLDFVAYNNEVFLPNENDWISIQQKNCFAQEKIYWNGDGKCYDLLQKGTIHKLRLRHFENLKPPSSPPSHALRKEGHILQNA